MRLFCSLLIFALAVLAGCGAGGQERDQVYVIKKATEKPMLGPSWDSGPWAQAHILEIASFMPRSSDHRPKTQVKLLYDHEGIYLYYRVEDRYVKSVRIENQTSVCKDSCVEFFVRPKEDKGYLNFEFNCGGTKLLKYNVPIRDPKDGLDEKGQKRPGVQGGKKAMRFVENLPLEMLDKIKVYHSMPRVVPDEIQEPTTWELSCFIPFEIMESKVGPLDGLSGQTWHANFYKCADDTSRPHWGSWSPMEGNGSFHRSQFFGPLRFE